MANCATHGKIEAADVGVAQVGREIQRYRYCPYCFCEWQAGLFPVTDEPEIDKGFMARLDALPSPMRDRIITILREPH